MMSDNLASSHLLEDTHRIYMPDTSAVNRINYCGNCPQFHLEEAIPVLFARAFKAVSVITALSSAPLPEPDRNETERVAEYVNKSDTVTPEST